LIEAPLSLLRSFNVKVGDLAFEPGDLVLVLAQLDIVNEVAFGRASPTGLLSQRFNRLAQLANAGPVDRNLLFQVAELFFEGADGIAGARTAKSEEG
jgi:hypothetical protein